MMMEQTLGEAIITSMIPILMALVYGEFRLRFFTGKMDSWFKTLREWGPRLVGSVRLGNTEQVAADARNANPLVDTLVTVGENANAIEGILNLLQSPMIQGLLKGGLGGGGGPVPQKEGGGW